MCRYHVVSALAVMFVFAAAGSRAQSDAAMSCQQLSDAVNQQNATIKQANDDLTQLQNARPDPGEADPAIAERKDQIAADRATKRANELVAAGRQRQCFK